MSQIAVENKMQLGQLLLGRGIVTEEQIEKVLAEQKDKGHRKLLGELLVEMNYCTENQIASALAEAYGVPYAQVGPKICDVKALEILPRDFLEEHIVLPLFKVYDVLTVAAAGWIARLAKALVERNKLFKTVHGERVAMGFYIVAQNQF